MESLNTDIYSKIFGYLSLSDLAHVAAVSKAIRDAVYHPAHWTRFIPRISHHHMSDEHLATSLKTRGISVCWMAHSSRLWTAFTQCSGKLLKTGRNSNHFCGTMPVYATDYKTNRVSCTTNEFTLFGAVSMWLYKWLSYQSEGVKPWESAGTICQSRAVPSAQCDHKPELRWQPDRWITDCGCPMFAQSQRFGGKIYP